uniref:Uncharacterized protein n=1 Tax=Astyanax mexicanus TaxID=7994 RepID=A0A8B9RJE7_ASTMX
MLLYSCQQWHLTCVNGPLFEQTSVFVHFPAVTGSVLPRNGEHFLILKKTKTIDNVLIIRVQPELLLSVEIGVLCWELAVRSSFIHSREGGGAFPT